MEIGETRIARAEIVDCYVVPSLTKTKNRIASDLLTCCIAFSDLDAKIAGRNFSVVELFVQHRDEVAVGQVGGGDIDVDTEGWTGTEGCAEIAQSVAQHQLRDLASKPLLFGDLHKNVRTDSVLVLIGPANQGFSFDDVAGRELNNGL